MQVDDESNQVIRLKAKDGKVFDLSMAAASISELIINASEGQEDSDDPIEIEIDRLSSEGLGKVVEFMNHYKDEKMVEIPSPLGSSSFDEIICQEWYKNFVSDENLEGDLMFELLSAANFMMIKPLLDLMCLKATFLVTGKSADEIRQILRLPEMTAEEEANARRDHKWIFENE